LTIARLLEKLRIEATRSRPRHTNDNALAESENGAIVRKLMGYSHVPQEHASRINAFYTETLNPYLNFHRLCYFAVDKLDAQGKIRKTYPHHQIMTPWERLKSISEHHQYLKPGMELALGGQSRILGDAPFHGRFIVEQLSDGKLTCTGPIYRGARMNLGPCARLRTSWSRVS
jgi:hypothetical protein